MRLTKKLVFTGIFALGFIACGTDEEEEDESTESTTTATPQETSGSGDDDDDDDSDDEILYQLGLLLEDFQDDALARGRTIPPIRIGLMQILMVDEWPDGNLARLGICETFENTVTIKNPGRFWEGSFVTRTIGKKILYHEVGHCLYFLVHSDDNVDVGSVEGGSRVMSPGLTMGNTTNDSEWQDELDVFFQYTEDSVTGVYDNGFPPYGSNPFYLHGKNLK